MSAAEIASHVPSLARALARSRARSRARARRGLAMLAAIALLMLLAVTDVAAQTAPRATGLLAPAPGDTVTARVADPALEARVLDIAHELRCLVCQNESIAASNAPLAVDLRARIREQLQAGRDRQQILDAMVERYGEFVRYRPGLSVATVVLWLGPFALLALAVLVGWRRVRRPQAQAVHARVQVHDRSPAIAMPPPMLATGPSQAPAWLLWAVPALAAGVYALVGSPAALLHSPYPSAAPAPSTATEAQAPNEAMNALVQRMAQRLSDPAEPGARDPAAWELLARSYMALQRVDLAERAYARAIQLTGEQSGEAAQARPPAQAAISGHIRVAPALVRHLREGDTLFVLARAERGSRMPLAIARVTLTASAMQAPLPFMLDDSMAMSPQWTLSQALRDGAVLVEARVSRSGEATPRAGDLTGTPARAGDREGDRAHKLDIVIDTVRP